LHDDRRIRIREAKKHVDPVYPDSDPDPEHCFLLGRMSGPARQCCVFGFGRIRIIVMDLDPGPADQDPVPIPNSTFLTRKCFAYLFIGVSDALLFS
jgi:hypothetical protein